MQLLLYPVPPREIGGIFKCIRKSVLKDRQQTEMAMNDAEKVDLLWQALNRLLTAIERNMVTVGDLSDASNALRATEDNFVESEI